MKFGDIILNTSSGERNPLRVSMFIRYSGEYIETMSRDGKICKYNARDQRKNDFLKVVGWLDLSEWDACRKHYGPSEAHPIPNAGDQP